MNGITSPIGMPTTLRGTTFLEGGEQSYFLLACMDRDEAYALPLQVVQANMENLNTTRRQDGKSYCHIALNLGGDGALVWNISKVGKKVSLQQFAVPITASKARG
jgi:hypothetical protein